MKRSFRNVLLLAPLAAGLVLSGCGNGGDDDHVDADSVPKVDTTAGNTNIDMNQEFIGIPAPSEMLMFIKMTSKGGSKNTSFLNPVDNLKTYQDNSRMALNFGIYSCDLTYCSIFDIGSTATDYFKAVKTLGEEIGVSSVITPEIMKKAEANIKNPDTLAAIADEIYLSSFEMLEANAKGPTLALVIAGGYIESLNIAANVIKYDPKNPAVSRFADQKLNIENIILFLKKYESDPGVADAKKQYEDLKTLFDQLKEVPVEQPKNADPKKKVFGGGTVLEMTKEQFTAISAKIKEIRNNFAQIK
jgi:hypothetical protein